MNKIKTNIINKLKSIYKENIEVLKTLSVINGYCKVRSYSESIYNISNMLKELEENTDKICKSLADIIDSQEDKDNSAIAYIPKIDRNNPMFVDD